MPGTVGGPFAPLGVTRNWTDTNKNFVPDCDLLNTGAQDLSSSGGDVCSAISNLAFGSTTLTNNYDPALLNGWGVRASDWSLGGMFRLMYTRQHADVSATITSTNVGWTDSHSIFVPQLFFVGTYN